MNSISRNSRPDGRSRLKLSPGLSPGIRPERTTSKKSELLSMFQENEQEFNHEYDMGDDDDEMDGFDDQFQTLKLSSKDLETLRSPPKKTIKFDDQLPHVETRSRLNQPKAEMNGISPPNSLSTRSSTNVPTQKTLSDYGEDDTEVTSQYYDKDFEDLDNIFGSKEGDIYNKMTSHLKNKQQKLQRDAELEEMELNTKFHHICPPNQPKSQTNTLRIKDFNNTKASSRFKFSEDFDNIDNENTINYEYTRDEYEKFEDGFENFNDLDGRKIKKNYQAPRTISIKNSMPNFALNNSTQSQVTKKMRKFKSSVDLHRMAQDDVHPIFNNNNKIIRKLERIPSFYNQNQDSKKQSLLDKYKENIPSRVGAKKSQASQVKNSTTRGKKIGLVRYLNDEPVANTNSRMKYDPINRNWEGNDIDLMKFESIHKPALITKNDLNINANNMEPHKNMIYDNENLRWVNLDEDDDSLFNDIPDLDDTPKLKSPARGISTYTQRTTSTNSTSKESATGMNDNDTFDIPMKMINKFLKEESKIVKKTKNWFGSNQVYNLNDSHKFNIEYFWEIRKMVVDNED